MSVITPPRVYFDGFMEWDPNTCNNNKWLQQWDMDTSDLNWSMLQKHGVTPSNFQSEFPKWASTLSPKGSYPCQPANTTPGEQPALWNYFGGNGCNFVNNNKLSTLVSGGIMSNGQAASPSDALLRQPITLQGSPFNGHATQARLVDVDAASVLTSQIWFDSLEIGNTSTLGMSGQRLDIMHSRLLNFKRNQTYNVQAGVASCVWQCTIPNSQLKINTGSANYSPLLADLQQQASQSLGIMLRFCTYMTLYFKNGLYNDEAIRPTSSADIVSYYAQAFAGKIPYFSNPAYSRTVGAIGVWHKDDIRNAPADRTLFAVPPKPKPGPGATADSAETATEIAKQKSVSAPPAQLGPIMAGFSYNAQNNVSVLHLDLSSTFPEIDAKNPQHPVKANLGSFQFGIWDQTQAMYYKLADLHYSDYDGKAYLASSGMVDLPVTQRVPRAVVDRGELLLRAGTSNLPTSQEQEVLVETCDRAVYIDQGETSGAIDVSARVRGSVEPFRSVVVARYTYDPSIAHTAECEGALTAISTTDKQIANFAPGYQTNNVPIAGTNQTADILPVSCNANGNGQLAVTANNPGFVYLIFFPTAVAQIPATVSVPQLLHGNYGVVRVMPFDSGGNGVVSIQQQFVDAWNGVGGGVKHDPDIVWQFVYNRILYFYDMIYPVMTRYVPLGDRKRVEAAVDQLLVTLSSSYMQHHSTMMMPITRDLSAGKRWVLLAWCGLVKSGYQPVDLPKYQNVTPSNLRNS